MEAAVPLASENHEHLIDRFISEAAKVILDKDREIRLTLCCLIARGNMLVEDVPGVGKTMLVKLFARLLGLETSRIQFTNDMLPADIVGSSVYDAKAGHFLFHKGPIFAQLVMADEINRATPKSQSACLQAMEEQQVTADGQTFVLPQPFFLVATQNPRQYIGTFPLPESQLDRFLMKIQLGYPSRPAERELLLGENRQRIINRLDPVIDAQDLINMQNGAEEIRTSQALVDYLQDIIAASRLDGRGLSPRGALGLLRAAKAWAFIAGRGYVIPEDVQAVAIPVMNHRLASADDPPGAGGIERAGEILARVPVE